MTEIIISILYTIAFTAAVVIPVIASRGMHKYMLDKMLDVEDEILHELTACKID